VLQSSRRRTALLLLLSVFFSVIGGLMIASDADFGWLVAAFGLVGTAVFAFMLVRPHRLELDERGFTTVTLGRRWRVEWSQCGEFRTWNDSLTVGAPAMVVFDCSAPSVRGHPLEATAEGLTGANSALPDTYGMSASKLAALLNDYRAASASAE
jgi:hypothetical protein